MDNPQKSKKDIQKEVIKTRIQNISDEIARAEKLEQVLNTQAAKDIETTLIDADLAVIRAGYNSLNPLNDDFKISFSQLQGAERQLLKYKVLFQDSNIEKKRLVKEREMLLKSESQIDNDTSTSDSRIISSKLKKE